MLKIAATTALFAALLAGCATSPVPNQKRCRGTA